MKLFITALLLTVTMIGCLPDTVIHPGNEYKYTVTIDGTAEYAIYSGGHIRDSVIQKEDFPWTTNGTYYVDGGTHLAILAPSNKPYLSDTGAIYITLDGLPEGIIYDTIYTNDVFQFDRW